MDDGTKLTFGEFIVDVRSVVTSPRQRFALIQERGALWGSLFLLMLPAYFGMTFTGGIFFDRDPFPGYSFILPAIAAAVLVLLKMYFIHVVARLFQGKGRYRAAVGRFRDLAVVFGYTSVPAILAGILALLVFLLVPDQLGAMIRNLRAVAISIAIAIGVGLFIWNLILMVLALRTVYPMRDLKIVIALLLGSIMMAIPAAGLTYAAASVKVDFAYLQPILAPRIVRIFAADPTAGTVKDTKMSIHIDLLAYRFKAPKRFELVAYTPSQNVPAEKGSKGGKLVIGSGITLEHSEQILGRIVGAPGDRAELVDGKLRINGVFWVERYIAPEFQSTASIPEKLLGSTEHLILPEDRRLIDSMRQELIVMRDHIVGRAVVNKYPLGWCMFRSTVFLSAEPSS